MRVVFFHPFTSRIGVILREVIKLKSHKAYQKYEYFIPEFFNHKDREVAIFMDAPETREVYGYLKCILWMIISKINPFKVKILNSISQLDEEKDILIAFPFLSCHPRALERGSLFLDFPGLKVFHFTHYFNETNKICSVLKSLNNSLMIGEVDLKRNALYQKHMGDTPFYILPFVLRKRYQSTTDFYKRKAKCLACGTKSQILPQVHREFYELFQCDYLHQLRWEFFEKKQEIEPWIESLIFDFYELKDYKPKTKIDKLMMQVKKKIGNDRKHFFSFDIVKKYNEYQMFVSPEEESGAPSISFIEGMACGCCYFGKADIYTELGMVAGVHYVSYDGTLAQLIECIQYHQQHPEITAKIALQGKLLVEEKFRAKEVADEFWIALKRTKEGYGH